MVNVSIVGKVFDEPKTSKTKTGSTMVQFTIANKTGHKKNADDKYYMTNFYKVTIFLAEKMLWKVSGLVKGSDVAVSGTDFYADAYEGKNGASAALNLTASDITVITSSDAPTNVESTKHKADYSKKAVEEEATDEEAPF